MKAINIYNYEEERDEYYSKSYDPKQMKGTEKAFGISGNDSIFSRNTSFGIEKTFIPALYFGFSKDFRITSKLSAGISYNRLIGFSPFYREETKTINFQEGTFRNEQTTISGTASQLLFSVKYKLK